MIKSPQQTVLYANGNERLAIGVEFFWTFIHTSRAAIITF